MNIIPDPQWCTQGSPAVRTWGSTTNTFSVICVMPSHHLCPTVSAVDCSQEIPQLWFSSWDDRPVAVPQERLCPGWIHQHLCSWQWDWVGLRGRRQAPPPILSMVILPHHCWRKTQLLWRTLPPSQTPLPPLCLSDHILLTSSEPQLLSFWKVSTNPI